MLSIIATITAAHLLPQQYSPVHFMETLQLPLLRQICSRRVVCPLHKIGHMMAWPQDPAIIEWVRVVSPLAWLGSNLRQWQRL